VDLSSGEKTFVPEAATLRLELFDWRFGKLLEQDGSFAGVTLEISPTPLPWLKLRFPFLKEQIQAFHETLGGLLDEEPPAKAEA